MANYTLNRTGAQIDAILNHAANEWTVIEDVTLSTEEREHEKTGMNCSEVIITVTGYTPPTGGDNMKLSINGSSDELAVWHNANQPNSGYGVRVLPISSGCYMHCHGGASQWQNYSPLYMTVWNDATNSTIKTVKLRPSNSSFPAGCKITIIGRA